MACDTFSESPKTALRRKKQDNGISPLTFCRPQILTFNYFFGHFRDLGYITDPKLLVQALFSNFFMHQSSLRLDGVSLHSGWDPRQMDHKVFKRNRYDYIACSNTCDHTSTSAPDPNRTPQLRVLGRE